MNRAESILDRIVRTKREEVAALERRRSELVALADERGTPRSLVGALTVGSQVAVIAEVKRRSPGAGEIRPGLDPVNLASTYEAAGAAAISVLTDQEYFGGTLGDLSQVEKAVSVPVLRKDFIIDELQVVEARAAGADAVLLIVRILDDDQLSHLHGVAVGFGLEVLVEAHDGDELERALAAGARIVGVNNRDLSTFKADLGVTLDLLTRVPEDVVLVSESGIAGPADVSCLGAAGVDAVLVGEWILRQDTIPRAVSSLTKSPRRPRGGQPE